MNPRWGLGLFCALGLCGCSQYFSYQVEKKHLEQATAVTDRPPEAVAVRGYTEDEAGQRSYRYMRMSQVIRGKEVPSKDEITVSRRRGGMQVAGGVLLGLGGLMALGGIIPLIIPKNCTSQILCGAGEGIAGFSLIGVGGTSMLIGAVLLGVGSRGPSFRVKPGEPRVLYIPPPDMRDTTNTPEPPQAPVPMR